jgi:hypothetical protein
MADNDPVIETSDGHRGRWIYDAAEILGVDFLHKIFNILGETLDT